MIILIYLTEDRSYISIMLGLILIDIYAFPLIGKFEVLYLNL